MVPVSSIYSGPMAGGVGSPAMSAMPTIPSHSGAHPGASSHMGGSGNLQFGGMCGPTSSARSPLLLYTITCLLLAHALRAHEPEELSCRCTVEHFGALYYGFSISPKFLYR